MDGLYENLIKMDDLGVPLFSETSIYKLLFFCGVFSPQKNSLPRCRCLCVSVSAKQKLASTQIEHPSGQAALVFKQCYAKNLALGANGRKKFSQMRPKWDWKDFIPAHPRKAKKNKLDIRRNIFQSHSCNRGFNKKPGRKLKFWVLFHFNQCAFHAGFNT